MVLVLCMLQIYLIKYIKVIYIEKCKFYIAAPFFNASQRDVVNKIKSQIESKSFEVFSPMHEFVCPPDANEDVCQKTFLGNLRAIDKSRFIVAVTTNKDMGTLFEAGYGFKSNKEIIYFAQTLGKKPFNLMLAQSCIDAIRSFEELDEVLTNIKVSIDKGIDHKKHYRYTGPVE